MKRNCSFYKSYKVYAFAIDFYPYIMKHSHDWFSVITNLQIFKIIFIASAIKRSLILKCIYYDFVIHNIYYIMNYQLFNAMAISRSFPMRLIYFTHYLIIFQNLSIFFCFQWAKWAYKSIINQSICITVEICLIHYIHSVQYNIA